MFDRQKIEALAREYVKLVYKRLHPFGSAFACQEYVESHWRDDENIRVACEIAAIDQCIAEQEVQKN